MHFFAWLALKTVANSADKPNLVTLFETTDAGASFYHVTGSLVSNNNWIFSGNQSLFIGFEVHYISVAQEAQVTLTRT